jgi:SAM-dependent methyltransferase
MVEDAIHFDTIYTTHQELDFWTARNPPRELVGLVEGGDISPCRTLEVGCGQGYNSIYLASKGFAVAGIDISPEAIKLAEQHAKEAQVSCMFTAMDWRALPLSGEKPEFVFDWRFLHEILDEDNRKRYVEKIASCLGDRGKYLSVSFNDQSTLGGTGKIRTVPSTSVLYFASLPELEQLMEPHFRIMTSKLITTSQKEQGEVSTNYLFMEKR